MKLAPDLCLGTKLTSLCVIRSSRDVPERKRKDVRKPVPERKRKDVRKPVPERKRKNVRNRNLI